MCTRVPCTVTAYIRTQCQGEEKWAAIKMLCAVMSSSSCSWRIWSLTGVAVIHLIGHLLWPALVWVPGRQQWKQVPAFESCILLRWLDNKSDKNGDVHYGKQIKTDKWRRRATLLNRVAMEGLPGKMKLQEGLRDWWGNPWGFWGRWV